MASTNINIRTDSQLKEESQKILSQLGMDMTTLINMMLRQLTYKKTIPFDVSVPENISKKIPFGELMGMLKGKMWISEDFDEPLDCMEEYM
ncbi:MAG: type II toxin-antitoxin system RelB/DinJ family antitoxin [Oscillospiraceae bacterium]|nr:type II toxin-antitoxin system RelB/DinJ family antitoxin [Oscillospiraceae bacterium]